MTFSKPRAPSTAFEKGIDSLEREQELEDMIRQGTVVRHQETTSFAPKWVSFLSVKDLKRFIFVTFKPCFIGHFIYLGHFRKCQKMLLSEFFKCASIRSLVYFLENTFICSCMNKGFSWLRSGIKSQQSILFYMNTFKNQTKFLLKHLH